MNLNLLQRVLHPLRICGKGRFADFLFSDRHTEVECQPVRGATLLLRTDQRIERWMWAGAYEPELVSLLKHKLRPGMTVFDIGANIGYFSVIAAALVGPYGKVHAFEPMPQNFLRLEKNLRPFKRAIPHRCAVGSTACNVIMHYSDTESGWASVYPEQNRPLSITAEMIRLDDWLGPNPVERIDFLKLDIEGGELDALLGGQELLRRFRPTIVAEMRSESKGNKLSKLLGESYQCRPFGSDSILATPMLRV